MAPSLWYDIEGNPIDRDVAQRLLTDLDARLVAVDEIDGWRVSTVHIVMDHQFGDGPPLIFETMVFRPSEDVEWPPGLTECVRTATKEAALAMHDQVLCELRNALARNCL